MMMIKKFGNQNITVLYKNQCYNGACYNCTIKPDQTVWKSYQQEIKIITSEGKVKINFDKQVQVLYILLSFYTCFGSNS